MENSSNGYMMHLAQLRDFRAKRVSSWDRTGRNRDSISLAPGESKSLAEIQGAGCIRYIYVTLKCPDPLHHRKVVLRMFWDGESKPSVDVPIGDFFGIVNCQVKHFSSMLLSVNPGATWTDAFGFNVYFPMPFSNGARVELENEGEHAITAFWYQINYEEVPSIPSDMGRFHATWNRQNPTVPQPQPEDLWQGNNLDGSENYVILDAKGRGQYVGCVLGVDNVQGGWWGDGDDMIFVDGEPWPPTIHGTGTEEIFGAGPCPNREYAGPFSGTHLISNLDWRGNNGMYRFQIADPIPFYESIRVTLEHGHNNELANDYSSVAYWYQTEPHMSTATLIPVDKRLPRMPDTYWEVERRYIECIDKLSSIRRRPAREDLPDMFYDVREQLVSAFSKGDFGSLSEIMDRYDATVDEENSDLI